jgi:hypothetical protein
MAVALVLGFLSQFIALMLLSCSFMRSMSTSIKENASYYQQEMDEQEEKLLVNPEENNVNENLGPEPAPINPDEPQ